MTERNEENAALADYFRLMGINGSAHVLQVGQQIGIFKLITESGSTAAELARTCQLSKVAVELFLDVLCALGLLVKSGEDYKPGDVMQFVTGNYQDLGQKYWDYFPEYLKTGKPLAKMDEISESEKHYQVQAASLEWMMSPSAHAAARVLRIGEKRKDLSILDVGAGSAVWSLTFASYDSTAHVTALDWPAVLELSKSVAERYGVSDRFSKIEGNYFDADLPAQTYDMIILGNVTHLETQDGNIKLFEKLKSALRQDGDLVIFDIFPGQPQGDLFRSLYTLGLGLRTQQGRVHSKLELQDMLKEAGYERLEFHLLPAIPHTMGALVARKIN